MAPSVEKKIAELEMGLLHLQQNIDIPDISLSIHQTVAQVSRRFQASSKINVFKVEGAHVKQTKKKFVVILYQVMCV